MSNNQEIKEIAAGVVKATSEISRAQTRTTLRIVIIVLTVILAVAAALWTLYRLTDVLLLLVLAIFFAYLVAPLVEFAQRPFKLGGRERVMPRALAIGLVYVFLFACIIVAVSLLIPKLGSQFPAFAQEAKSAWGKVTGNTQSLTEFYGRHGIPPNVAAQINTAVEKIAGSVPEYTQIAVETLVGWLSYIPWLVLIPILAFFLLKDAESFRRSALQMLPRGRWRWRGDEFFQDVNSTLAAYIRAQLTASLLVGTICGIAFALFGLPNSLALGVIAGALEFVPLVGPLTMVVLAAVITSVHSGIGQALLVMLFLGVFRIAQDYVIYPRLIGQGIHLHPLAVILAILCGAELAGIPGVFLAIPVIAVITVTYRHWLEHRGSESIGDILLQSDTSVPPLTTLAKETEQGEPRRHPTSRTTPEEMAKVRPDLTTGELKLNRSD
jgi:predicted PurR-regulated permease PerM